MKNNPFVFGKIVKGVHFLDRRELRDELSTEIYNHTNVILYAPRRYGKTSLVLKVFEDIRRKDKKFCGLMVDFYRINTKVKFIEIMADEYAKNSGLTFEKLLTFFRNTFTGIVPSVEIDQMGNPKIKMEFSPKQTEPLLKEILNLSKKLADSGKLVCVFFDEFQEIRVLNGKNFQKELRSEIQHHDNVSYFFTGSKFHLIKDIFESAASPLYHIGKRINLAKIGQKFYQSYMVKKFKEIGYDLDKQAISMIYDMVNGVPYYVQMMAHEIYNLALINKSTDSEDLVNMSMHQILANKNDEFLIYYENLNLSSQITLDILIRNKGKTLFSREILAKYPIAASTIKKALNTLIEKGAITKTGSGYEFNDVFFEKWLRLRV